MEYWKISDFSKAVGKHTNTVDGWFKQLEEKRLHWVSRTEYGEKVYDQLDMDIALYIKEHRDQKWALDGIFNELPNHFELRPIPKEENTSVPQNLDFSFMRKEFENVAKEMAAAQMVEIKEMVEEMAAAQISQVKQQYEEILKSLPKPVNMEEERQKQKEIMENLLQGMPQPKSVEEERQERITEMITRRRIEAELEKEALNIWSTKPESERKIRVGIFRKEEDRDKRYLFIRDYINQNFESRFRKEYESK